MAVVCRSLVTSRCCFSGVGIDAHSHSPSPSPSLSLSKPSFYGLSLNSSHRKLGVGALFSEFSDSAHLDYYSAPTIRCDGKKKKDPLKKKAKLLKALSKDLTLFSGMGFGLDPGVQGQELQGNTIISEAADRLLAQLQKLKAEEKELKRKKKLEKAKLKASRRVDSSSSSSSSSSDSECGELVDMSRFKSKSALTQPQREVPINDIIMPPQLDVPSSSSMGDVSLEVNGKTIELQSVIPAEATLTMIGSGQRERVGDERNNSMVGTAAEAAGEMKKKIEVCMGGKCKKSGAAALLGEFQRIVGVEDAVVGCKCMGKCRDGPNVRVLSQDQNPLCIGVGFEDVTLIVSNFFAAGGEAHAPLPDLVAS